MKKQIIYLVAFLFAISFVSAIATNANAGVNAQGQANLDTIQMLNANASAQANIEIKGNLQAKSPIMNGEYTLENGQTLKVSNQGENKMLRVGNVSVNCSQNCNLTQIHSENKIQLHATLSNGRNAEVKIMPETASERALTRLNINSCEESNCTIELKEVGQDNSTKIAYEVKAKKQAKFLGLFNSNIDVSTQIDAETGEVIQINKPWWVSIKAE